MVMGERVAWLAWDLEYLDEGSVLVWASSDEAEALDVACRELEIDREYVVVERAPELDGCDHDPRPDGAS
jgi:hypothetical protein